MGDGTPANDADVGIDCAAAPFAGVAGRAEHVHRLHRRSDPEPVRTRADGPERRQHDTDRQRPFSFPVLSGGLGVVLSEIISDQGPDRTK